MVEYSNDLKDRATAASYYRNLLEVRRVAQEHHLPYINIPSANQLQPQTTIPSPANLAFQVYTTLAAGYRGVTLGTYFSQGYHYAPVDLEGNRTANWGYLQAVNREVMGLAPVMSRLESTGVFFTSPAPVDNLPSLPGRLVESATCPTPLMIGEFRGPQEQPYVMSGEFEPGNLGEVFPQDRPGGEGDPNSLCRWGVHFQRWIPRRVIGCRRGRESC